MEPAMSASVVNRRGPSNTRLLNSSVSAGSPGRASMRRPASPETSRTGSTPASNRYARKGDASGSRGFAIGRNGQERRRPDSRGSTSNNLNMRRGMSLAEVEYSPRLTPFDAPMEGIGAALLPELAHDDGEKFCTTAPVVGDEGVRRSSRISAMNARSVSIWDTASRIDNFVAQATLLLSERVAGLRSRVRNATMVEHQSVELCDIADGVAAASYHLQKWIAVLDTYGNPRPAQRPSHVESPEEAFAVLHTMLPRLSMSAKEAQRCFAAAAGNSAGRVPGQTDEDRVRQLGVPPEDLRAFGPHLERLVARVGRLSSTLRVISNKEYCEFVVKHFQLALGDKTARTIVAFLGPKGNLRDPV